MASRKSDAIREALLSKGFRYRETDHTFLVLYVGGKQSSIRTKISHGIKEYGDDLLAKMCHQVHLRKADLLSLVDCPMSHEQYVATVAASGHLKLD